MHILVNLLLTAIISAHAALGSSIHDAWCAPQAIVDAHEARCCHCDHAAPSDKQPAPEKCEEQCCVFVVSRPVVVWPVDLGAFVAPLVTPSVHTPVSDSSSVSPTPLSDVRHPAGRALHIWQCCWVI